MARDLKRIVRLAVAASVATAVLVAGFIALDRYLDPFDDRPFDPASWAAADEQQRGPMARDAARHVPHGTPAERVRELLGEPDHAVSDNPPDKWGRPVKGYTRWSYWLGCWSVSAGTASTPPIWTSTSTARAGWWRWRSPGGRTAAQPAKGLNRKVEKGSG